MKTRPAQTTAPEALRVLRLRGSVVSPYMQMTDVSMTAPRRDTTISVLMKAYIDEYLLTAGGTSYAATTFVDDNNSNAFVETAYIASNFSACTSSESIYAQAVTDIQAYAVTKSYGTTTVFGMFATTNGAAAPAESALSISLQTSTGAVGTQVSATRNSWVTITGSISTTATIGGASAGHIYVEVAPTNSATAGDWVEKGRVGNSQTITLAIALNSVQVTEGSVTAFVPAGYYVKARSAGSGTFTNTFLEARQVLI